MTWSDTTYASRSDDGYFIYKWVGVWAAYAPGVKVGTGVPFSTGHATREDAQQACIAHRKALTGEAG